MEFLTPTGQWDWPRFQHLLPPSIILKIVGVRCPTAALGPDVVYWMHTASGQFSTRSAYFAEVASEASLVDPVWALIWSCPGPQRVRTFLWSVVHEILLTNLRRFQRHLAPSPLFPLCSTHAESTLHVLRDCTWARALWGQFSPVLPTGFFTHTCIRSWVASNLALQFFVWNDVPWQVCFAIVCWCLWLWRNEQVFNSAGPPFNPMPFLQSYCREVMFSLTLASGSVLPRVRPPVVWLRPPVGWVKLNTDGAVRLHSGVAAVGGVLRGSLGEWLHGFSANLGSCSVLNAELWGLFYGLRMAYDLGYRRVMVEVDSLDSVRNLLASSPRSRRSSALLRAVQELLHFPWETRVDHVYREGNCCADWLAKFGFTLSLGVQYFEHVPVGCLGAVLRDLQGG